jgi:hypothetical protein
VTVRVRASQYANRVRNPTRYAWRFQKLEMSLGQLI